LDVCADAGVAASVASSAKPAKAQTARSRTIISSSPGAERIAERLPHMRPMDAAVVALLRAARHDLEIDEQRTGRGQQRANLLLEVLQVGERVHRLVAGGAREASEVDIAAARDRMAAVRLVGAVLAHEVIEVWRRDLADGDQG